MYVRDIEVVGCNTVKPVYNSHLWVRWLNTEVATINALQDTQTIYTVLVQC